MDLFILPVPGVRALPVDLCRRYHQHRPMSGHTGPYPTKRRTAARQDHDHHRLDSECLVQFAASKYMHIHNMTAC